VEDEVEDVMIGWLHNKSRIPDPLYLPEEPLVLMQARPESRPELKILRIIYTLYNLINEIPKIY
jgi:hypothetical protein